MDESKLNESSISSISIDHCINLDSSVDKLCDWIHNNKHLQSVSITSSPISSICLDKLASVINIAQLKSIEFKCNQIDGSCDGFKSFINMLTDIKQHDHTEHNFETLNLWWNRIGDDGAILLASAIKMFPNLQRIALGLNHIGDKGAKALADSLNNHRYLKTLDLSANRIGNIGAKHIGKCIQQIQSIGYLNLSDCNIDDEGFDHILNGLCKRQQNAYDIVIDTIHDCCNTYQIISHHECPRGIARAIFSMCWDSWEQNVYSVYAPKLDLYFNHNPNNQVCLESMKRIMNSRSSGNNQTNDIWTNIPAFRLRSMNLLSAKVSPALCVEFVSSLSKNEWIEHIVFELDSGLISFETIGDLSTKYDLSDTADEQTMITHLLKVCKSILPENYDIFISDTSLLVNVSKV